MFSSVVPAHALTLLVLAIQQVPGFHHLAFIHTWLMETSVLLVTKLVRISSQLGFQETSTVSLKV